MELSDRAREMAECKNAGGSSIQSEVMSFELFHRCFGATLLQTEMEIGYFPRGGPMVDYTCEMFGVRLGVSVTRAMKYKAEFENEDAERLLDKKLTGIIDATTNAVDKWCKVLHIWATSAKVADTLAAVYKDLCPEVRQDTVVMVTVVTQPHHPLFR
ncbi:AAC-rich mRNA clone AAC4 protein-like [Diadema antillarum]|uniref:AAC-rich mRNA clone AAC4 protein-like n=1 Tax=Diadema antillarum TaxID=105358 RepID=UPI003A858D7C